MVNQSVSSSYDVIHSNGFNLINPVLPWPLVDLAIPLDDVIGCRITFLASSSLACGEVCVYVCVW